MSISAIITAVATLEATITGVKKAWDESPESINELPCFVNIPASGDIDRDPMLRRAKHLVKMQLFVTRANLSSAETLLRPFVERTLDAFDGDINIGDSCNYSRIIHYDYGVLTYAGHTYLGISFDLEVYENDTKDFAI